MKSILCICSVLLSVFVSDAQPFAFGPKNLAFMGQGGSQAPAAFHPTNIAGLVGWWRIDDVTNADATAVLYWPDAGPNGYHLQQGAATQQPIYYANMVNSLGAVRFDYVNDHLTNLVCPNLFAGNDVPITSAAVVRYWTNQTTYLTLWSVGYSGDANTNLWLYVNSDKQRYRRRAGVDLAVVDGTATIPTNQFLLLTMRSPGTTASMWTNNVQDLTNAAVNVAPIGAQDCFSVGVQVTSSDNYPSPLYLSELILWTNSPSDSQLGALRKYLMNKYGLQ